MHVIEQYMVNTLKTIGRKGFTSINKYTLMHNKTLYKHKQYQLCCILMFNFFMEAL